MNPYITERDVYERQQELLREAQVLRELRAARPRGSALVRLLAQLVRRVPRPQPRAAVAPALGREE